MNGELYYIIRYDDNTYWCSLDMTNESVVPYSYTELLTRMSWLHKRDKNAVVEGVRLMHDRCHNVVFYNAHTGVMTKTVSMMVVQPAKS